MKARILKKSICRSLFTAVLFLSASLLFSYNWPVSDPVVTSTFGGNKWDTFGSGLELFGDDLEVRPSEDGAVIFYEDDCSYSRLPSGLGNFVVIEHDRKLRTLYGSINPAEGIEKLNTISTADVIATTGHSGKSVQPNLYFAVIDSEFEQFVNPLLLLNSIIDTKSPVIREVGIKNESGYLPVEKKAVVNAGDAEIIAEIYDPCMSGDFYCRMAPFKIHLFLNGEEIFYVNFESLKYEAGKAVIQSNRNLTYSEFYQNDGYVSLGGISLVPGDFRFEILVSDYSGNETGRTFQLTVVE